MPFIAFVISLYLLYQRVGLCNTHAGLILAYQFIALPFTVWTLRSFSQEISLEIQEVAKVDGCSWLGVLIRVILSLSLPGILVTVSTSPIMALGNKTRKGRKRRCGF